MNQTIEPQSEFTTIKKQERKVDLNITYDSYVAMRTAAFRSGMNPATYLETIIAEGFTYRPLPNRDKTLAPIPPAVESSPAS